ncbi:four-carbon acid sugar kinase family protein [Clostridium merdae]|uniref:four-carbon acid sugar kinase family protein n=1 Tax=Clostridium merdae TaxID=1958780 RepID=UPI000A26D7A5|nr:four-carbon acid sugar kinase family protein [Clostridium merdae]
MARLLIIADDFTGAFDTGVQFAARGAATTVVTDPNYDFRSIEKNVEVLVMVAETRHLSPKDAYAIVYNTVIRAQNAGITYIYKKTDSALRGNVGSELTALMDATGITTIPFLPALPKLNRITKEGIHYINGVPVAQSVFGQDPFEPVLDSSVAEILGKQTTVPVVMHPRQEITEISGPGIHLFDAETDADLRQIGKELGIEHLQFCAGCAGFAAVLADLLNLKGELPRLPVLQKTLFVVCGSVNPVTISQMKAAQEQGFPHVNLTAVQKLEQSWANSKFAEECIHQWLAIARQEKRFILDANDPEGCKDTDSYAQEHGLTLEQLRVRISTNLAVLMKRMLDYGLQATLLCTGGDTLLALMRAVHVSELTPICELATGVVLTKFVYIQKTYHIISKSGGFGERDLLLNLAEQISQQSISN